MGTMKHITWQHNQISKEERRSLNGHKSMLLWFTGLSGAGKSTISIALERELFNRGLRTYVLDGDNIRFGLNKDLGFKPEDRKENIRRIGEVAKLMVDAGGIILAAFISPYREDRNMVRKLFQEDEFIEIYIKCSLEECKNRDPKGLYKKASNGEIKNFTGIDAPYEEPLSPEITIETNNSTVEESVQLLIDYLLGECKRKD